MDEHNSTGQPGPMFHHNIWKIFLLISDLNLVSFHFKPLPFDLSLQSLVKISLLLVLKGYNKICPEPAFPQTEKSQVPQPFSVADMFQPYECLCGPPLDSFHQVHVYLVLGASEGDTELWVGSH